MKPLVPFMVLEKFRVSPVDWPRILSELYSEGVTMSSIASLCGRAEGTVNGWRNRGHVPRHEDGETILALHRNFCAKKLEIDRVQTPTQLVHQMS